MQTTRSSQGVPSAPRFASLAVLGALSVVGQVLAADGTAAAPSLSFTNSPTTGFYRQAADTIGIAIAGVERGRIGVAGNHWMGQAVVYNGSIGFTSTGIGGGFDAALSRDAAHTIAMRNPNAFTTGQTFRVYKTYTDASNYERFVFDANRGASSVGITYQAAGTGAARDMVIQNATAGALYFGVNNALNWLINTGHLQAVTDNTLDIGASGSNRPRNLYVAGLVNVAGTAALGATTVTGTLAVTSRITTGGVTIPTSGTGPNYHQQTNTGGSLYVGQEGSVAGSFFTGAAAYSSVIYSNQNIELIVSGVRRLAAHSAGVSVTGPLDVSGVFATAGALSTTAAGSTSTPTLHLNGVTNNWLGFNSNGVGVPTNTVRSLGTKVVYYPVMTVSEADYAVGVAGGTLWHSVPSAGNAFQWYGGTTAAMTLTTGTGLSLVGTLTATGNATVGGRLTVLGADTSVMLDSTKNWLLQTVDADGRFRIRNDSDAIDAVVVSATGLATLNAGLTVAAGASRLNDGLAVSGTVPVGTAGLGLEVGVSGGAVLYQAYNRTTFAYGTALFDAAAFSFRPGGTTAFAVSSALAAVTGNLTVTSAISGASVTVTSSGYATTTLNGATGGQVVFQTSGTPRGTVYGDATGVTFAADTSTIFAKGTTAGFAVTGTLSATGLATLSAGATITGGNINLTGYLGINTAANSGYGVDTNGNIRILGANPTIAFNNGSVQQMFSHLAGAAGGFSLSSSLIVAGATTVNGTFSAAAGTQASTTVSPTFAQTGTAAGIALLVNPTGTFGSAGGLSQSWQMAGVEGARMSTGGGLTVAGVNSWGNSEIGFSGGAITAATDLRLARDAADTLALRRGANAQNLRIYSTYTDASNYQRAEVGYNGSTFNIGTTFLGTGASTPLQIGTVGASTVSFFTTNVYRWQINPSGHFLANADNTYDIGAVGATRPRHVYVAGNVNSATASISLIGAGTNAVASAYIKAAASTTAVAHLNLTAGVGPTTPGAGDIWNDGARLALTMGGVSFGTAADVQLNREAADDLGMRRGTVAQAFRVYNTYTDAANYERLSLDFTSNLAFLRTQRLGTGVARNLVIDSLGGSLFLQTSSATNWQIISGHFTAGADNTYDIGNAGANRPRSLHLGSKLHIDYTNTATVGAVTINKAAGRVNVAATGTSVVVTNSFCTAAAHVFAVISTNDSTAYVKNVVPAAGSFTINLGAAATAQTSIDFFILNAD